MFLLKNNKMCIVLQLTVKVDRSAMRIFYINISDTD